jgi:hypothetical protein
MDKMENLTDSLTKLYTEVNDQEIELDKAKILKGVAGQIINAQGVQIKYNIAKQKFSKISKIKFLED